jgi:hypothetical protein
MTKTKTKHENREQWLAAAVTALTPLFTKQGYKVPAVRVSCGWPSSRGIASKKFAIGECWDTKASTDKLNQIFISPRVNEVEGEYGVLPILAHELAHAIVGIKEKHNKVFGKCVRAIGLEGKLTSTTGGEAFWSEVKPLVSKLGAYPHSRLNPDFRPTKKQTTRLVKCECGDCGYNVRVTRKWLDTGAPICPCNSKSMGFTIPDELEAEGDE